MKKIKIFDCNMDIASIEETVAEIDKAICTNGFIQHGVVNAAKLVNMQSNSSLHRSVSACHIVNIDGMGVVWAGRMLGHEIPERVAGIDLFCKLLSLSVEKNYPVFFLGAKSNILDKAINKILNEFKGIKIAGYHHGYFWEDERYVVELIRQSGAKLLFVAITSPKKEDFINKWCNELGVNFVMGVGGTFDVVSGAVSRAPKWMQAIGLEWLHRLLQEPRRMWKRYLITNSKFIFMLLREWIALKNRN